MKVVRTVLALWICMAFALSGVQGVVLCIEECLRISLAHEQEDGGCADNRSGNHEDHQDRETLSVSRSAAERCCYKCVDIPLSGGRIPECTVQRAKVTKISKVRAATCLNVALLSHSNPSTASSFGSSRPVLGSPTLSDRTVVLRI